MKYCDNCGSKLEEQQNFCPYCGKSMKETSIQIENKRINNFSFVRVFVGVIVTIALVIAFIVYRTNIDKIYGDSGKSDYSNSSGSSIDENPDYVLKSDDLIKEYQDNAIRAEKKYKGKIVEVTGKIESIDKDILNNEYISISGGGVFDYIQCYISKSEITKIDNYKTGDKITIVGRIDDYELSLTMKNGKIKSN